MVRRTIYHLLALCLLVFLFGCGFGGKPQPQNLLDRAFNPPSGYALFSPQDGAAGRGVEVALQSDGRIIVMGSISNGVDDDLLLMRYTTDGLLDHSFGTNGSVRYDGIGQDRGLGLVIMADDAIVATGYSTIAGSRDLLVAKFSRGGVYQKHLLYAGTGTDIGFGVTVSHDQKVVVVGESSSSLSAKQDLLLLRMNADLQLDPTFGRQGVVHYNGPQNENEKGFGVVVQPDGKVVACGAVIINGKEDMLVARFHRDGTPDTGFGTHGSFVWSSPLDHADFANNLALLPDGRLVVTGAAATTLNHPSMVTLRLLGNGTIDSSFGQAGVATYSGSFGYAYPFAVVMQRDGGLVVVGTEANGHGNKDAVVIRYTTNGLMDQTFGIGGVFAFDGPALKDDAANGVALQADQSLVVTGYSSNGLYDAVLTFRLKPGI